jgi:hypothetical protein
LIAFVSIALVSIVLILSVLSILSILSCFVHGPLEERVSVEFSTVDAAAAGLGVDDRVTPLLIWPQCRAWQKFLDLSSNAASTSSTLSKGSL